MARRRGGRTSGQQRLPRARRILYKLLLAAGASLAALLLCELALRFTEYRYLLNPTTFPDGYFRADPLLGADLAPNRPPSPLSFRGPGFQVFTNFLGCFDHERPVEEGYLLALGDSVTWGYVPLEDNWATLLERHSGRQILKCGVPAVGIRFQVVRAERIVEQTGLVPAAVILVYTDNDLHEDVVFPGYTVVDGQRLSTLKSFDLRTGEMTHFSQQEVAALYRNWRASRSWTDLAKRTSLVAWFLYEAFTAAEHQRRTPEEIIQERYEILFWELDPQAHPWLDEAIEGHLESLWALRRRVEGYGARLVLFDLDELQSDLRRAFSARLRREFPDYFRLATGSAEGPPRRALYHRFDPHWNVAGNREAAAEMYARLRQAGVL